MELYTAKKARRISDKKQTEKLKKTRNIIIELIREAVNHGDYNVTFCYRIEPKIAEELEELGYQVDAVEYATIISWEKIKEEDR